MSFLDSINTLIYRTVGTGFFTGYIPFAPGTFGSVLCFLILWFAPEFSLTFFLVVTLMITIGGVLSAAELEKTWGRDSQKITIDEFAGIAVALVGLPKTFSIWIIALVLFRLFDIVKPPPIRLSENLPGGFGVVADDVIAGLYTNVCCWMVLWIQ